jgi:hypothetical protein
MPKSLSSGSQQGSSRLADRVYWAVIGVLAASIVWLMVGYVFRSEDGTQTTATDQAPAAGVTTRGGQATSHPTSHPSAGTAHSGGAGDSASAGPYDDSAATSGGQVDTRAVSTDPLTVCRQVFGTQQQLLQEAAASMDQWEVHVGAMNKLVVGAITLPQATQFWNQTRVGAMAHLDSFTTDDGQYQQRTTRCPPPAGPRPSGDDLDACERGVAERGRVLKVARVALATWQMHVMHMEMLREGKLTPARATQLWLQSWREGQQQIDRYRTALGAAHQANC